MESTGQRGPLWSHLAAWDDLLVPVPSTDASHLDLGEGWPDRWLVARRVNGDEVSCTVRDLSRMPGLDDGPVRWFSWQRAQAARVAFNLGLAQVKAVMDQRAAQATYGITGDSLTPAISWSLYALRKHWNAVKGTVAPWWAECSKEAFNTGLDQLARALKNWAGSRTGKRKGKPAGFPRFRSRRKARPSIRFTTGAFRCEARHAVLPRIGRVKLHEPGTRLADLVTAGTGRVER